MPYFQSLYDILGIAKSASADEIRKAYRRKALETHPDKLSPHASTAHRHAAEAQFHLIHNAFETLGDPQRRKAYDAWGSKLDPSVLLEESVKRREDREAWASGLKAEYERRKVSKSQTSPLSRPPPPSPALHRPTSAPSAPRPKPPPPTPREPREPPPTQNILPDQEQMIKEMLQEVRAQLPPDYEERKRRVLQKKAERERERGDIPSVQ